jgi:hypothetical protein
MKPFDEPFVAIAPACAARLERVRRRTEVPARIGIHAHEHGRRSRS